MSFRNQLQQTCAEESLVKAASIFGMKIDFDYSGYHPRDEQIDLFGLTMMIDTNASVTRLVRGNNEVDLQAEIENFLCDPKKVYVIRQGFNSQDAAGHFSLLYYKTDGWNIYSSPTNHYMLFNQDGSLSERAVGDLVRKHAEWGENYKQCSIIVLELSKQLVTELARAVYNERTQTQVIQNTGQVNALTDLEIICNKLKPILATYDQKRFKADGSHSRYRQRDIFHAGYAERDKYFACEDLSDLLNGNSNNININVLRDGRLGAALRTAARELAITLNNPHIATVRGLVQFIIDSTNPILDRKFTS